MCVCDYVCCVSIQMAHAALLAFVHYIYQRNLHTSFSYTLTHSRIERNEKSFFLLSSSSIIFICFQFLPFCFVGPSPLFSVLNSIRICCFFHSFSRTHPVCMRVSVCGLSSYNPPNFPFKLYLLFYNETCHCLFNNSFSVQDARELCLTLIKKNASISKISLCIF